MNGRLQVFVLAKNEARNIGRCLEALAQLPVQVTLLLDTSSSDDTEQIASGYPSVTVTRYEYVDHCAAYNEISTSLVQGAEFCVILDADMIVTGELFAEVSALAAETETEVVRAPVLMHAEGLPLRFGSLYPPKPIAFRVGRRYFVSVGHGEALTGDCRIRQTQAKLIHDDRKSYGEYLSSQLRYAAALTTRGASGTLNWRDRLRSRTPMMILVTPLVSYLGKLGFLSGKPALVYALDRLIAEAVMFRQALASKLRRRGQ